MIFTAIGVAIYLAVIIVVVASAVKCSLQRCSRSCTVDLSSRTLFITAHPDDECMFFAPLILALTAHNRESAFLLCLSEGKFTCQKILLCLYMYICGRCCFCADFIFQFNNQ